HDDSTARRAGGAGDRQGIAADRLRCRIDHGPATRALEQQDLVLRHLLVEEPEVVEIGVEVLADPAEVRQAHRLPRAPLVAGRRRLREHHLEIDQEVLVGQGDADRVRRHRAEHRLDLSGERLWHPYRKAGAISVMNRSRSRRSSYRGRNMLGMKSVSTRADRSYWICSRI